MYDLGSETVVRIEKHVTTRLLHSASEPCTNYKNTAYPSCLLKFYITELLFNSAATDCEKVCKVAAMQDSYELLPNNSIPKCLTVKAQSI
jgi:hypothetical protein